MPDYIQFTIIDENGDKLGEETLPPTLPSEIPITTNGTTGDIIDLCKEEEVIQLDTRPYQPS